ncbi:MAG: undecaprenyl-diphosphate phosphatase [Candidatus Omnitrophota bacterium]
MKSLLFGLIQGLTEFLPISSSGHLNILNRLVPIDASIFSYIILLHLATLCAVLVFFWKKIIILLSQRTFLLRLFFITLITGVIGLLIKHFLKENMEHKYVVTICLLINAIILFTAKMAAGKRTVTNLSWRDCTLLGFVQGIAVLPGISRSGITIVTALRRGFIAQEAFDISFIMSIPAILGAFLLEAREIRSMPISGIQIAIGSISAFIVGLITLFIVRKVLIAKKFQLFGYYCLFLSIVSIVL